MKEKQFKVLQILFVLKFLKLMEVFNNIGTSKNNFLRRTNRQTDRVILRQVIKKIKLLSAPGSSESGILFPFVFYDLKIKISIECLNIIFLV
jgi:hypothetical protein